MNKIKRIIALCCVGVTAVCFASCKPDAPEAVTTTTTEPVSETTTVETTAGAPSEPGETPAQTTQAPAAPAQLSTAEIVEIFNLAYNKTKATGSFIGQDQMTIDEVKLSDKKNSMVSGLAASAVGAFYTPKANNQLYPQANGFDTSQLTEADLSAAEIKDNGATYSVKLTPIESVNPTLGSAGAGRMFDLLPPIGPYFEDYGGTWTTGTADDNIKVTYNGYCEATIDKNSGLFTAAYYNVRILLEINNGKLYLPVNGAAIDLTMTSRFPV